MKRINPKLTDPAQIGYAIVQAVTSQDAQQSAQLTPEQRSAIASALGRLGGSKGGNARAKKLSKKRMREIAVKAAKARWSKRPNKV